MLVSDILGSGLDVFFAHPRLLYLALLLLVIVLMKPMGFLALKLHLGKEGGRKEGTKVGLGSLFSWISAPCGLALDGCALSQEVTASHQMVSSTRLVYLLVVDHSFPLTLSPKCLVPIPLV